MTYLTSSANNEIGITELFTDFFNDNFVKSSARTSLENILARSPNDTLNIELLLEEVLNGLNGINVNKGRGPDDLHPILLKNCASSLAAPLQLIFNKSLSEGLFPFKWKTSYILHTNNIQVWQDNVHRKLPGRSNTADSRKILRLAGSSASIRSTVTNNHYSPTRIRPQEIMCNESDSTREHHNEGTRVKRSNGCAIHGLSKGV